MSLFGGRSHADREHLEQTLRSLGPTSVGGLSAALSWSPRRTQRALLEAVSWGRGAIEYDPVSGRVGFRSRPVPSAEARVLASPPESPAPARVDPPPLPKSWNPAPKCPACDVPFVATGSGSGVYCPNCGRLSLRGASGGAPPTAPPAAAEAPPVRSGPATQHGPATTLGDDRHSQELFAAWVTSRPIPCPKCRTSLRHRGVGQYACPACGAQVAFEGPASRAGGHHAPAAPPPAGTAASPAPPSPVR